MREEEVEGCWQSWLGEALLEQGEGFSGAAKLRVLQELLSAPFLTPLPGWEPGEQRCRQSRRQEPSPGKGASVPNPAPIPSGAPGVTNASLGLGECSGCWGFVCPGSSTVESGAGGSSSWELEPANHEDGLSCPAPVPS